MQQCGDFNFNHLIMSQTISSANKTCDVSALMIYLLLFLKSCYWRKGGQQYNTDSKLWDQCHNDTLRCSGFTYCPFKSCRQVWDQIVFLPKCHNKTTTSVLAPAGPCEWVNTSLVLSVHVIAAFYPKLERHEDSAVKNNYKNKCFHWIDSTVAKTNIYSRDKTKCFFI